MRRPGLLLFLSTCSAVLATAQTTQGLISGRLVNSQRGNPISGAQVSYWNSATGSSGSARSDPSGNFFLPLLSPGYYRIRAAADSYQAQEVHELELPVAARLELNFRLRPLNDVWEAGQYRSVFLPGSKSIVTFYGPDVDSSRSGTFEATRGRRGALESTVSQVIDPLQVRELPLAGRDVYAMLVTQPGVTADAGTARGLGVSINGQRPSSSNFMLDGLENNNYVVTGPLTAIAPEAVQEYRVSTNNFSAEYGRTAGFVANAVTRAGGNQFHGIGYTYFKNEALNANGFQENLKGLPRPPAKENQIGFQIGGPIRRERLFFSSAYEHLRSRARQDVFNFRLPSPVFATVFPNSLARRLLDQYPPLTVPGPGVFGTISIAPPVSLNRSLAIQRFDYRSASGFDQVMGRVAIARVAKPDFIWSPYKDFISGLDQDTLGIAVSYIRTLRPGLMNEAKLGRSTDDLGWDRAHPEIPTLVSGDSVVLPSSQASYGYRNRNRTWEFLDNIVWARGRHVWTVGGGFLLRSSDGFLTIGRDGLYRFQSVASFGLGLPSLFGVSLSRQAVPRLELPVFDREYHYRQSFAFLQDTFKATARLAFNYGFRYEQYGAPRNTGSVKDAMVELGQGGDFAAKLATARVIFPGPGDQQLYRTDSKDFAIRFGFSYDPLGSGRTLVRGAYGIFYDRPFDNLWQNTRNNNLVLVQSLVVPRSVTNFLAPVPSLLSSYTGQDLTSNFPNLTLFDPGLRNAYAQSYFLGVLQQAGDNWTFEVNGLGSLGRRLIVTDLVNREFSVRQTAGGRYNPDLPDISYRAAQGSSNYHALAATARYRASRKQFHLAYTWSHTIDNQSEPLSSDFFDLFGQLNLGDNRLERSAFSRQFDSRADRGNSDFDQRHNLVFFSIWELPTPAGRSKWTWLWRDWRFSQMAAFRSGFPYSIRVATFDDAPVNGEGLVLNNRANVIDPGRAVLGDPVAVPGGKRLLQKEAFGQPGASTLGNSGRNSISEPGLYNIDISLSRSFPISKLGESGRIVFRADVFNFLNHANLNNPDSLLSSPTFGIAQYGRQGRQSSFPALSPFTETARQIQLIFRIEF